MLFNGFPGPMHHWERKGLRRRNSPNLRKMLGILADKIATILALFVSEYLRSRSSMLIDGGTGF